MRQPKLDSQDHHEEGENCFHELPTHTKWTNATKHIIVDHSRPQSRVTGSCPFIGHRSVGASLIHVILGQPTVHRVPEQPELHTDPIHKTNKFIKNSEQKRQSVPSPPPLPFPTYCCYHGYQNYNFPSLDISILLLKFFTFV